MEMKINEMVVKLTTAFQGTHLPVAATQAGSSLTLARPHPHHAIGPTDHPARAASYPYPSRSPSVSSNESSTQCRKATQCPVRHKSSPNVPIQGAKIPDLKGGPSAWRQAIRQWEEGNASIGFLALKDWLEEWYKGAMRTVTGAKRRERELVVLAYNGSVPCSEGSPPADRLTQTFSP